MNKLFYGDNLDVLQRKIKDETVDLCYIDPPFNSKRDYFQIYNNIGSEDYAQAQAFEDTWAWGNESVSGFTHITDIDNLQRGTVTHQTVELVRGLHRVLGEGSLFAYLVHMTLRIIEIHRVLKPTGSFYLHCDPAASHYLKLIVDSVFCSQGGDFKNEIVWRRTGSHNKMKRYGPIHDVIFFYTKSKTYTWKYPKRPYMKGHVEENFVHDEKGWKTNYYGNVLTGSGTRSGESGKEWRGFHPTAKGRHWAIPGLIVEDVEEDISAMGTLEKLEFLYQKGLITIVPGKAWPMYERYLTPSDGQAVSDIWSFQPYTGGTVFGTDRGIDEDVRWLSPKDKERLGYPTQKPESLLERIITASTNDDDVVLDAYCGCGTTVAVAQKLNRQWIGIDITYQSISLILKRLEDNHPKEWKSIEANILLDGVPRDMKSAVALANRKDDKTRKEFEKWAVLTYSDNQARINPKKGADAGIDGIAYFLISKEENGKVIFQVKSGGAQRNTLATLNSDRLREKAEIGILITMDTPTAAMRKEALAAGKYKHPLLTREDDRIQIVTIAEILSGARINLPMGRASVKSAEAVGDMGYQHELL